MQSLEITKAHAEKFFDLHVPGTPLCLFNCWDVATAKAASKFGPAVATGSGAAAFAQGYDDGQNIPVEYVLGLAGRIAQSVDCPTTIDFEAGYTDDLELLSKYIVTLIESGVVGINLEDSTHGGSGGLASIESHLRKIESIRRTAEGLGVRFFINARSDAYLLKIGDEKVCLQETLLRGAQYKEAGASGLFVPFLYDLKSISEIVETVSLPLNILGSSKAPAIADLSDVGVARVSLGGWGYEVAMAAFSKQAKIFSDSKAYPIVDQIV